MCCDILVCARRKVDIVLVVMLSGWDCASGMPIQKPPLTSTPEHADHPDGDEDHVGFILDA